MNHRFQRRFSHRTFIILWLLLAAASVRGEAMLELFQLNWNQVSAKMPELAEAGYDSLWLPNPAKGTSGGFSIGYDIYDPFDLGDKNQQGTTATMYGTKADLLNMVQTAHRFGIRIYFDNVMNHRGSVVPGFNSNTPTNYYPGLIPQDFHLQTTNGNYQDWNNVANFCYQFEVQSQPLLGLVDLANEPGSLNNNFGASLGSTITKPKFIRHPNNPEYYLNTNGHSLGGAWFPFNGTNGTAVADDVSSYLIRAAMWTLYTTKCDGFRLDAVKHTPSGFFGSNPGSSAFSDEPTFAGYTGGIQAMYDYTHGYGNNVTSNGYVETDGNRNSLFNMDATRNDAMIFGEHVAPVPDFQQYLQVGMRLCNQPLYNQMNNVLSGNASFSGMDGRDYTPSPDSCNGTSYPCYSAAQSVMFPQTQDGGSCCPVHQELQDAYYFMHEGLPMIYTDGFNHAGSPTFFPGISYANFLGEFGDNRMPDIAYLHNQLSRGGTSSRWSDQNIVAFERYDYRESTNMQDEDVVLFAMNDKSNPGDITFDDGVSRTSDGYYGGKAVSNSRSVGLVVGFPPGSVLAQLSSTSTGGDRAYTKLLVHGATQSLAAATSSANATDPTQRLIYVGNQTLASGGGAIEFTIPSGSGTTALGGWVMYGYQWPEASRANPSTNAIIFRQGGVEVPHVTVLRKDGPNGDTNYNPLFPFKMRGSVDTTGAVVGGTNVSSLTYAIDVPVLTNAPMDVLVRSDASAASATLKLDGGIDLNSQMGLGATNGIDLRDNRPGYATDVYLGFEQTALQFRNGPEKFAARNIASNNIVSFGAETYVYTSVGSNFVVNGAGTGVAITNQTATWVFHDPTNLVTALGTNVATQRVPVNPGSGSADVWVKVGYQFQINFCYIYYTTDGSNPEGAFGIGKGTTQVIQGHFFNHDSVTSNIDWWKGTIPASGGSQVRYKVALFNNGIAAISDAETSGSKYYGLTQAGVTNFNPTNALVWLHNDLNTNNTTVGLQEGYHIMRAHVMLPRTNKSSVYNTFVQTFYYDASLPNGVVTSPTTDGSTISNATYTVVVRADSSTTGVTFNIADSNPNNDDSVTHLANGNGLSNGVPVFASAQSATPNSTLSQLYPSLPLEYHFTYVAVPNSGAATITVHLNKATTSVFTNRYTSVTRTVNTAAPTQVLQLSSPATEGQYLYLGSNDTYNIQACFTQTLDTNNLNLFSIFINGVMQPRRDSNQIPLYTISAAGASPCGTGLRTLSYPWTNPAPGTNFIQVMFTNAVVLSDQHNVTVVNPYFSITSLNVNQGGASLVWDSAPNLDYQVWATTNLTVPMAPISGVIPAAGNSTFFSDPTLDPTNKFYRIQLLPQ